MKCTSPSRTLRRVAQHLKANPSVVCFMTLIKIDRLRLEKLTQESELREALMQVADLINLPRCFRKYLIRLTEIIDIARRCIKNALEIKARKLVLDSIVMIKKATTCNWFKIVGFSDDSLVMIQSVSNGRRVRTITPHELDLAIA